MHVAAIIVAAGRGVRAGEGIPKQWRPLAGITLAERAVAVFRAHPRIARTVLVIHGDDHAYADGIVVDIRAEGGHTRADSVLAGLEALEGTRISHVLVHDAARATLPPRLVDSICEALHHAAGAAPVLSVPDALWRLRDGRLAIATERAGLVRAQTPQGFEYGAILAAHRAYSARQRVIPSLPSPVDDVAVARAAGISVEPIPGDWRNLKITTAEDFHRAERIILGQTDIRQGHGVDAHRFGPGSSVKLCGVVIPHGFALLGHSDADVGIHALCDAIYGALGEGDIGRHFPPDNPEWRDADSSLFLAHAAALVRERGFRIGNADCTLICEAPRIAPHAPQMVARLAALTGVEPERISVKATTTEGMGFTGRGEGITAFATVNLISR